VSGRRRHDDRAVGQLLIGESRPERLEQVMSSVLRSTVHFALVARNAAVWP
jgi:hypothetical protein